MGVLYNIADMINKMAGVVAWMGAKATARWPEAGQITNQQHPKAPALAERRRPAGRVAPPLLLINKLRLNELCPGPCAYCSSTARWAARCLRHHVTMAGLSP